MIINNTKITDLIPYVNNARTHSDEQILQIASSIKEFGFTNPILTDGENGIIAGHGRLMAAKKLGMEEVPTIELSHLSAAQKKAYIIADNKLALNSGWDNTLLALEFEELEELGFDLSLIGFDKLELNELTDTVLNENQYTREVKSPIYEQTGIKPVITDLYNTEKTQSLINAINENEIEQDIKDFLIAAAKRHTEFNYRNIAEYYAHSSAEVQELMESSALVIIDFNKAIELGFVVLTDELTKAYEQSV